MSRGENFFLPQAQHRKNFFSYPLTFFSGGVQVRVPKGGKRKQATSDPLSHSYFNTPRPPHYLISKNRRFYLWGCQKQAFSLLSVFRICKNSKHCEMCDISQKCPPFRLALCLLGDTPKTPSRNLYLIFNPLSDIKPTFLV